MIVRYEGSISCPGREGSRISSSRAGGSSRRVGSLQEVEIDKGREREKEIDREQERGREGTVRRSDKRGCVTRL